MPHAYTEDQLVEQPAIGLFAELGWQTVSAIRNLRRTRDLLPRTPKAFASGAHPGLPGQVELELN